MNERISGILLWIIGVLLITGAIILFFPQVSAAEAIPITEVGQGVYLGDTVDIRLVLGWGPELAFAWYKDGIYSEIPDQIYKANDYQNKYYLDPLTFKVGKYYKWSGAYERASYPLAFEILPGTRPIPIPTAEGHTLPEPTATPEIIIEEMVPQNTHIILTRGDNIEFWYGLYGDDPAKSQMAYIWLFPVLFDTPAMLGTKMMYYPNRSAFTYSFAPILTEKLAEGWYTGYIQFTGKNGFQDVYYDYQTNSLDTPYDDQLVPDVSLDGYIPIREQQEFEKLTQTTKYCDDVLVPITMSVRDPYLMINDYYEDGDLITVRGTTAFSPGTNITIMIDPERWALAQDKRMHTWYTQTKGIVGEERTFSTELKLNWDELAIGFHTIKASIEKHRLKADGSIQFRVSDIFVMPTPTPERVRIVVEDYGYHRITNTSNSTPIATTTTDPMVLIIGTPTPTITTAQTTMITKAPTPTAVPTPKPTPTIKVPVDTATILIAVGLGLWRIKLR